MGRDIIAKVARGLRKPPHIILGRLIHEAGAVSEKFLSPRRARGFNTNALLRATGADTLDALWEKLAARPYVAAGHTDLARYDEICPGDRERIMAATERALVHRIAVMGSGDLELGPAFDWHTDHKTGIRWEPRWMRAIEYTNLDRPSDVKVPWEISRLQWLMPAAQAYALTGDDRYAAAVRADLESWIIANPYAHSVNWACTMEPALRILSWSWFFHVCHGAPSWQDTAFRSVFLRTLYLHGDFTQRHLEYSDVNGNHCTADACGLVFAGLFFGEGSGPQAWLRRGWQLLQDELPRQVLPDGVDFEASVPYHRLVTELFFLPALYRERCGLPTPAEYREHVANMGRFTAAYARPDGTCPLWGDADDARSLPLGGQPLNDHRYLPGLIGAAWQVPELCAASAGPRTEAYWLLGAEKAAQLPATDTPSQPPASTAFKDGGFYVMRTDAPNGFNHVFIDCGLLGLAGRGGHGHNDILSFEAVLRGKMLISDCGAYLYTASAKERNNFRSTAYHNTPQVDGEEINRFIRPDYLWNLHNDAKPELLAWETGTERDLFRGSHSGYERLPAPVRPERTVILDHARSALAWRDCLTGEGEHEVAIPLHLAPGVEVAEAAPGQLRLRAGDQSFVLAWDDAAAWEFAKSPARVSPTYGIALPATRLSWHRRGPLPMELLVCIMPLDNAPADALKWARDRMAEAATPGAP